MAGAPTTVLRSAMWATIASPSAWRVAEHLQRQRHGAVDHRELAAADQALGLDQREVGLDAGRVAVHQERDRPRGREHGGLRVAVAVLAAQLERLVPGAASGVDEVVGDRLAVLDVAHRGAVLLDHAHHRLAIALVLGERPHARGDLGRLAIGAAGHERRDGRRVGAALVGVVGQAARHQQRAEVGVAEPQLAHLVRVLADLLGRVRRVGDEDLLRREDDVDRVLEAVDVELAVGPAEAHEVEAREIAGRVVDVHVLRARVRGVDAPRVRARVPVVDDRVELDARIGAAPGRIGDLVHEVACAHGLDDFTGGARRQVPVAVGLDRAHELVGQAHRVVGVLVLDRGPVRRVERHVVAGLLERARLLLLARLAPDELLDVGVIDVEHDHLGRAARLAARLDRAGRCIGPAHERDRPRGVAALGELLLRGAHAREVDAGARAAAEDAALLDDPVEDRVHRVVDGEDEAGGALRPLFKADVEPDGRVEGRVLVDAGGT